MTDAKTIAGTTNVADTGTTPSSAASDSAGTTQPQTDDKFDSAAPDTDDEGDDFDDAGSPSAAKPRRGDEPPRPTCEEWIAQLKANECNQLDLDVKCLENLTFVRALKGNTSLTSVVFPSLGSKGFAMACAALHGTSNAPPAHTHWRGATDSVLTLAAALHMAAGHPALKSIRIASFPFVVCQDWNVGACFAGDRCEREHVCWHCRATTHTRLNCAPAAREAEEKARARVINEFGDRYALSPPLRASSRIRNGGGNDGDGGDGDDDDDGGNDDDDETDNGWPLGLLRACHSLERLLCSFPPSQLDELMFRVSGWEANPAYTPKAWTAFWLALDGRMTVSGSSCAKALSQLSVSVPPGAQLGLVCDAIQYGMCARLTTLDIDFSAGTSDADFVDYAKLFAAIRACHKLEELELPLIPWTEMGRNMIGPAPETHVFPVLSPALRYMRLTTGFEVTIPGLADRIRDPNSSLQHLLLPGSIECEGDELLHVPDWWTDEMKAIGEAPNLAVLQTPDLRGASIGALAESLKRTRTLTSLTVHHYLTDRPNSILPVFTALRACPLLTELTVHDRKYESKSVFELSAALRVNERLRAVKLAPPLYELNTEEEDNTLDTELMPAVHSLIDVLNTTNRTLHHLDVPDEWFCGLHVEWMQMLRRNQNVEIASPTPFNDCNAMDYYDRCILFARRNWINLCPLLAFVRANRGHTFQYSVIPILTEVSRYCLPNVHVGLSASKFLDTKFAIAHIEPDTASAIASSVGPPATRAFPPAKSQ